MENSKKILKEANIYPRLRIYQKDEKGIARPTGEHIVELVKDKPIVITEFQTGKDVDGIRYLVIENGEYKIYERPVKNKKGDIDYVIQRLAEFEPGERVKIWGEKQGIKSITRIQKVDSQEISSIEEDEE